jgi:hypothetical protein
VQQFPVAFGQNPVFTSHDSFIPKGIARGVASGAVAPGSRVKGPAKWAFERSRPHAAELQLSTGKKVGDQLASQLAVCCRYIGCMFWIN